MPVFDLPRGTGFEAQANADPYVQETRNQQFALDEQRKQQIQRDAIAHMALQRQQQEVHQAATVNPIELQQHQLSADEGQRRQLGETMAADAAQWSATPEYAGKGFGEQPPEVQQHFLTAYPTIANQIAPAFNQSQREITGNPDIGNINPKELMDLRKRAAVLGLDSTGMDTATLRQTVPQAELQKEARTAVPNETRQELLDLGAWKNGMTGEEAQSALDDAYQKSGRIPARHLKNAGPLISSIQHDPVLAPFAKQKEAYDTMRAGYQNPGAGGFSDMAMIEGFQRIVNPGATVRQATMANMKTAAGWLQQLDPSFQWNKATKGDSLSPAARDRLMNLADAAFNQSKANVNRQMAGKRLLAQQYGIPGKFVDNLLNYAAQEPEAQPAQADPRKAEAAEWLKNNPKDPRAAAVRAALGQ